MKKRFPYFRPLITLLARVAAVFLMIFLMPSAAFATGGIHCESKDGNAALSVGLSRLPIYAPLKAKAQFGKRIWSNRPEKGEIQLGESQGFVDGDQVLIDFTDAEILQIIISLRVGPTDVETDGRTTGTLKFLDHKPIPVLCEFE